MKKEAKRKSTVLMRTYAPVKLSHAFAARFVTALPADVTNGLGMQRQPTELSPKIPRLLNARMHTAECEALFSVTPHQRRAHQPRRLLRSLKIVCATESEYTLLSQEPACDLVLNHRCHVVPPPHTSSPGSFSLDCIRCFEEQQEKRALSLVRGCRKCAPDDCQERLRWTLESLRGGSGMER